MPEVELSPEEDDKEEIFILGNVENKQRSILSECGSRRLGGRFFFKKQRSIVSKSGNWRRRMDFILRFR